MITLNNNSSNIHFTSLKSQKHLGDLAIKEFRTEFGYLKSSSNLAVRRIRLENKGALHPNSTLSRKLSVKQMNWFKEICDDSYKDIFTDHNFEDEIDLKNKLTQCITKKENKANCLEQIFLFFIKLLEKGENPHIFETKYKFVDDYANHFSIVTDLKENAVISNPKTWGSKAMIKDPYLAISKPAVEGLRDMDSAIIAGRELEKITYEAY